MALQLADIKGIQPIYCRFRPIITEGDPSRAAPARHRGGGDLHHQPLAQTSRPDAQKKSLRAAEQDRPDVARERRHWRVWQRFMDPARFVFLDETGTSTNMVRRYGRCPRGERLVDATPWGHWKITTFVAGLRASGLIAPMVLDGPMTGDVFRAYVEQVLVPKLSPGDVVVLDNLAAHKVAGIREAIRAADASLLGVVTLTRTW